ncbi:hypothetical protein LPJ81_003151 [Coemansia sp. IMI 209127]|nr:hypothetical protein LPJ81_003151 [Coemansia sp. IMI 209127]
MVRTKAAGSYGYRDDVEDFQESPSSSRRGPAPGKQLSGRTKEYEKNRPNRLNLHSSADATDPSRPRATSGSGRGGIPAISSTQKQFTDASNKARAQASRAVALALNRGEAEGADAVTQIDSDNSSDEETHVVASGSVNRSKIIDEATMVGRRRGLADTRGATSGMEPLFGAASMKGRSGSLPSQRQEDVTDVAASGNPKYTTPGASLTTPPRRSRPTNNGSTDSPESIKKKMSGFEGPYIQGNQRLVSLNKPESEAVLSPSNTKRRQTAVAPCHSVLTPPSAAAVAAAALKPENKTRIVDRLRPNSHKNERIDDDKAKSMLDTAGATSISQIKYSLFPSARARSHAAEDYVMSKTNTRSPQKTAARRKTAAFPNADAVRYPPKVIPLEGVQIGKYTKLAGSHHAHNAADSLKLTINYTQKCLTINGIKDGDEHMRLDRADIASIESRVQDDLTILRIAPAVTMENLFDTLVFDPSSDSNDVRLVVLCWRFQARSDISTVKRLEDVFSDTGRFPLLGKSDFDNYAAELNKPQSIDLISSSDDEGAAAAASKAWAIRTTNPPKHMQYWASIDPSANGSGVLKTPGDKEPASYRRRTAESSDDVWSPQFMAGKRKTLQTTLDGPAADDIVGYSGTRKKHRLRRGTMGGPEMTRRMYALSDSSDSDSAFSKQEEKEFYPNDYALRFEYPRGGPKAISVTGADISRLYRGEFLNDTIIEFYLRYIGENLRKSDPELYSQCFFFNSFFFKKLSHRARATAATAAARPDPSASPTNPVEPVYQQLKKWTASVELFDKKYIFVPINENIHWYLAIIVNPQGMTDDGTMDDEQTEDNDKSMLDTDDSQTPRKRSLAFAAANAKAQSPEPEQQKTPSEPKVGLNSFFSTYSPREKDKLDEAFNESEQALESSTDVDMIDREKEAEEDARKSLQPSPAEEPPVENNQLSDSGDLPSAQDVIDLSSMHSPKQSPARKETDPISLLSPDRPTKPPPASTVTVTFMDNKIEIPDSKYVDPHTTPAIIILDSLGNRHQPTFGLLRNYMQAEANSRLGVSLRGVTIGKYAKVPLQDNLCDCGVFLLHYVEEFVKDPLGFVAMALGSVSMRDWFTSRDMQAKRRDTLALAGRLAEEYARLTEDEQKGAADTENEKTGNSDDKDSNADAVNNDAGDGEAESNSRDTSSDVPGDQPIGSKETEEADTSDEPEK